MSPGRNRAPSSSWMNKRSGRPAFTVGRMYPRVDGGRGDAEHPGCLVVDHQLDFAACTTGIRQRRRKPSATATFGRSHSSAGFHNRSCMTTPRLRWPASSVTASGNGRGCSPSCSRTTCSRIGLADLAKATTRASRGAGRLGADHVPTAPRMTGATLAANSSITRATSPNGRPPMSICARKRWWPNSSRHTGSYR